MISNIAGPSMNNVVKAYPERRFKRLRLHAEQILNIFQGLSQYHVGDCINIPHVQFPPGTVAVCITYSGMDCGHPDSWDFLLFNPAWDMVSDYETIPFFEYETRVVHVFRSRT